MFIRHRHSPIDKLNCPHAMGTNTFSTTVGGGRGCAPSRAFRESLPGFAEAPSEAEGDSRRGALPNCRHLTLRCPEPAPRPFSSHFSCTAITDTQSESRNN